MKWQSQNLTTGVFITLMSCRPSLISQLDTLYISYFPAPLTLSWQTAQTWITLICQRYMQSQGWSPNVLLNRSEGRRNYQEISLWWSFARNLWPDGESSLVNNQICYLKQHCSNVSLAQYFVLLPHEAGWPPRAGRCQKIGGSFLPLNLGFAWLWTTLGAYRYVETQSVVEYKLSLILIYLLTKESACI